MISPSTLPGEGSCVYFHKPRQCPRRIRYHARLSPEAGGRVPDRRRRQTMNKGEKQHGKAHGFGSARTDPVLDRVPQERRVDSALARQAPVDDMAGAHQPPHIQRQGLRMLEPPLREVRSLHAPVLRGDGLQGAGQEQPRMLRVVPRLPRGSVRPPEQGPLRLQRVRAREVLPAHEERGSTSPTGPRPRTAARS